MIVKYKITTRVDLQTTRSKFIIYEYYTTFLNLFSVPNKRPVFSLHRKETKTTVFVYLKSLEKL